MASDRPPSPSNRSVPLWIWLLLVVAAFYTFVLGSFLGASPLVGAVPVAVAIAIAYSAAVCLWGRGAAWSFIGLTVAVVAVLTQFASVVDFMAAFLPGLLYIVFAEIRARLIDRWGRLRTFYLLLGSSAGMLALGWLVAQIFA